MKHSMDREFPKAFMDTDGDDNEIEFEGIGGSLRDEYRSGGIHASVKAGPLLSSLLVYV